MDRWERYLDVRSGVASDLVEVTTAEAEAGTATENRLWSAAEVRAAINAAVADAAEVANAEKWSQDKIGMWSGTQAEYNALTPQQRLQYNFLVTSG